MKIGNIELGTMPLFLAPMEDVTYKPFRYICKKYGADVMYTEFVSSEALIRDVKKTKQKMSLFDFDRPVAIQIYGYDINSMVNAAKAAEEAQPDWIDLNFGCPMKKIVRKGACSALLKDLPKMQQMAAEVVKAVNLPVTAKTRIGWDETEKPIIEVAQRLQDVGISALAVHGRTRSQIYSGTADWNVIAEVKNHPSVKLPIIGNGDINSPEKARKCLDISGVDGLMIGRGTIGRPWLFNEIKHYFSTGEMLPTPRVTELTELVREHLQVAIEWTETERSGILLMRRHFAKYFPNLYNFREHKIRLLRAITLGEVNSALDLIAQEYGDARIDYSNVGLE